MKRILHHATNDDGDHQIRTINTFILEYILDLVQNEQSNIPKNDLTQSFIQLVSKNYDEKDFVLRLRLLNEKFKELRSKTLLTLEDEDDDDELNSKRLNSLKKLLNEISPSQFSQLFPNAYFGKEEYLSKLKKWDQRLSKARGDLDSKRESLEKIIGYSSVLCNSLGSPRIVDVFSSLSSSSLLINNHRSNGETLLQPTNDDSHQHEEGNIESFKNGSQITTPSKTKKQQLTPFSTHVKNGTLTQMDETGDEQSSILQPSTLNFDVGGDNYEGFVNTENQSDHTDLIVIKDDEDLRQENLRKRKYFEGSCSFIGLKRALKVSDGHSLLHRFGAKSYYCHLSHLFTEIMPTSTID